MRIGALDTRSRRREWYVVALVVGFMLCCGAGSRTRAADKAEDKSVAALVSDPPLLLQHSTAEKSWQVLPRKSPSLYAGETILGGFGTTFDSANAAIRLRLMGDLNGLSAFPIVETVVTLEEAKDVDLALVMNRGQIDLTNTKKSGSAKFKITAMGKSAVITLTEPGARVAIEIYGRWQKGVRFVKDPKAGHSPAIAVVAVAIQGTIELKGETRSATLSAPPGPALLRFEDLQDRDFRIQTLAEVPSWVNELETDTTKKIKLAAGKIQEAALKSTLTDALDRFVLSENPIERRVAVFLMAGTDDLSRLMTAMATTKHLDVWDAGVIALRNWIGRAPGQDQKLYTALIERAKFSPGEAEKVMQLLHSFGKADLAKPEMYEALIDYLESDRLAIRGLAYWHLSRLVPAGKKIGYNPLAPKEERIKAIKEWQALIPAGTLPGQVQEKPKGNE